MSRQRRDSSLLGALLALCLTSTALAQTFTTFSSLASCDLGPSAAALTSQTSCSLAPAQVSTTLQPNQAVTIPFTNLNPAVFQGTSFQGWSSTITASNPTGASQSVFFMFGMCDSQASASACANGYYNTATTSSSVPAVCSTNCALSTGADAITIAASTANWKNPQYTSGLTTNSISISASVPSAGSIPYYLASKTDAAKFGSGFVFFMGSLSSIPITVQLTLTSVSTTQSPYPPSPPPPDFTVTVPDSGSKKLSNGAIAGIVVGSVVGVIIIAAAVFLIMKKGGRQAEVAPVSAPDEQPTRATAV